ncbi:unnamed protein product, partial [Polarella glacialis]
DRIELKVLGAKCILRVCTEPANLEILADHDTLLGVLSRELRETSKKSSELSVAIVCTFLCFSHFSQFHPILMQHQCGDVTMRVLEYESQRSQVRREDMERRRMRLLELGEGSTAEDKKLFAKDEKKYRHQVARQSKLMLVCLSVLLNLAEEISIEKKMVNRKIPSLLASLVERQQEDLILVTLQFLKKLSVFEYNKDTISVTETLSNLVKLAQHGNVRIALMALRVLFNLSFDENVRASLVESGIVKLMVDHLRNPPFRHIVLRLLYHFSMDDRCKSLMAYHRDGMVMLLQLVVHFPEPRVGKDLVALLVNLSTHARAAEVMVSSGLFQQVMLRVLKTRDPLLCKVIRHVSSHPDVLEPLCELLASESVRMSKWMHEFVRMAMCCIDNPDLLVEVLGTLANVTLEDGAVCRAVAMRKETSSSVEASQPLRKKETSSGAAADRPPAKTRLFWSLDQNAFSQALKESPSRPQSPSYAHDPAGWLLPKHQGGGELSTGTVQADERRRTGTGPAAKSSARQPGPGRLVQRPMIGRPRSATQLHRTDPSRLQPPQQVRQREKQPETAQQPPRQQTSSQQASAAPADTSEKLGRSASAGALRPQLSPLERAEEMAARVRHIGYTPGAQRKQTAESLFPKQFSDLPEVFERIHDLKEKQRAMLAEQERQRQEEFQNKVTLETFKDICVIKFPGDPGTRLLINRWSKGFCEVRSRPQSAPGREGKYKGFMHKSPNTSQASAAPSPLASRQGSILRPSSPGCPSFLDQLLEDSTSPIGD